MLNNRQRRHIWIASITIVAAAVLFNVLARQFFIKDIGPTVSCTSYYTVQSDLKTEGTLILNVDGVGHGRMNISAAVSNLADGKKYRLLRNMNFDYTWEGNGYVTMHNLVVVKKLSDNMPNELFNESIFDFSVETRRLRITEVGKSYLLWNEFSPVLMCTPNL